MLARGYRYSTIKSNPRRLKISGIITLTKNIINSFLHSPRIEDDNVTTSVRSVVKQPIKTTNVIITCPQFENISISGMAEEIEVGFKSKTIFAISKIAESVSAENKATCVFCFFDNLCPKFAIITPPLAVFNMTYKMA